MASEIRVNKIENRSGLGTVTFADTGVDLAGIVTATTFSGSGASLTNVPDSALSAVTASKLTGALPAISGASLTGMASTDNVRTGILDVAGISTFRNTMNVGAAVTISESGLEATGVGITVANINGGQIGGRRNKIYNGKMDVDQRNSGSSVSITNNLTIYTVDRFAVQPVNMDEATDITAQQVDDGPDGFTHSLKITTNTAESAIAADEFVDVYQKMEGQDFQDLAYNTSVAKDITMSFYVKSSITGTFGFTVYRDEPGTDRVVNKTYTINSANTWERKIITIAGDTDRAIQNTTGSVWWNTWHLAVGSNYDSATSSTWQNYTTTNFGGGHAQDGVITTAGATWQITGVQLEVGSQATPFEHRSYGEELTLCQRYYQGANTVGAGYGSADGYARAGCVYATPMRATPTLTATNTGSGSIIAADSSATGFYITYGSLGGSSAGIFNYVATAEL